MQENYSVNLLCVKTFTVKDRNEFAFDVVCEAVLKLWVQAETYDSGYLIVDLKIEFLRDAV